MTKSWCWFVPVGLGCVIGLLPFIIFLAVYESNNSWNNKAVKDECTITGNRVADVVCPDPTGEGGSSEGGSGDRRRTIETNGYGNDHRNYPSHQGIIHPEREKESGSGYSMKRSSCHEGYIIVSFSGYSEEIMVIGGTDGDVTDTLNNDYPKGKVLDCWYPPNEPSKVVIHLYGTVGFLITAIVFLIVGVLIAIGGYLCLCYDKFSSRSQVI